MIIHMPLSIIPTFGIRVRAALSCVGGRNAGVSGCNSRVLCRPLCIDVHWFLLISTSDIKRYNNLYLSFHHRWSSPKVSNTEFSEMSFYRLSWHQPKFHQFCPNNWPEIIWNFCVKRLLYQISAHNLITHFISFEELSYVDCQNVVQ